MAKNQFIASWGRTGTSAVFTDGGSGKTFFVPLGVPYEVNPTVSPAPTGVAATGGAGSLTPNLGPAPGGIAASSGVGSVTGQQGGALVGVPAVSAAAALTPESDNAVAGVAATSGFGTLTPTVTIQAASLSGVSANAVVGIVFATSPLGSVVATGQAGSLVVSVQILGVQSVGAAGTLIFARTANLAGIFATGHAQGLVVLPYTPVQFRIGVF